MKILNLLRDVFRANTPEEDADFRREVLGEYTAEELRQERLEDRAHYNYHARLNAFWTGATTYIDADGVTRDVGE